MEPTGDISAYQPHLLFFLVGFLALFFSVVAKYHSLTEADDKDRKYSAVATLTKTEASLPLTYFSSCNLEADAFIELLMVVIDNVVMRQGKGTSWKRSASEYKNTYD